MLNFDGRVSALIHSLSGGRTQSSTAAEFGFWLSCSIILPFAQLGQCPHWTNGLLLSRGDNLCL